MPQTGVDHKRLWLGDNDLIELHVSRVYQVVVLIGHDYTRHLQYDRVTFCRPCGAHSLRGTAPTDSAPPIWIFAFSEPEDVTFGVYIQTKQDVLLVEKVRCFSVNEDL